MSEEEIKQKVTYQLLGILSPPIHLEIVREENVNYVRKY